MFNFTPFPTLKTERLSLEQLSHRDKDDLFAIRIDDEVQKHLQRENVQSIDEVVKFIDKIENGIKDNKWIYWTLKPEDKLVGTICLWNISEDKTTADVGYELLPEYQGQGYMSEALQEVIKYGFEIMKLNKIEAYTNSKNEKSIKLLERYKFSYTSTMIENNIEHNVYAILNPFIENIN